MFLQKKQILDDQQSKQDGTVSTVLRVGTCTDRSKAQGP